MKSVRKILIVSWTRKKINEWVLETAGVDRDLLNSNIRRKLSYFVHVMRNEGDSLEKEIMQGTVPRARKQGDPGCDGLTTWKNGLKCCLTEGDRNGRRRNRLDHEATNHRKEDGERHDEVSQNQVIYSLVECLTTINDVY